jgi:hypothetical protein
VRVAQKLNCADNLYEIAAALKIWDGDHGDQFPFNVSTNVGGAKELCTPDKDGFDRNAYLYLRTMTNKDILSTPLILICPQDHLRKPAARWEDLQPTNITYRFRCGTNVTETNAGEILAICPIDGNILYADGKVVEKTPTPNADGKYPMHVK